MEMKLFSLYRNAENVSVKMQLKVIGSLNGFADSDLTFNEYTSLKEMFAGLSKALNEAEMIVIAVEGGIYNSTKAKLMSALSLQAEENEILLEKLGELDLDEAATAKNAKMPVSATLFTSIDGVNSGFAVKKGKQTIALIPLDEYRLDSVLKRGLIPYITNGGRLNSIAEAAKPEPVQEKKAEVEEKVEEPAEVQTTDAQREIALRALNILKEADVTIAVNGNSNSAILREFADGLEGFEDYFTFTPHIEDRGDYNVTDYTAQMARSAKGLSSSTLGACISDIFTTNDGCDYICISVSTDKSALVRKLYKEEDETDEQFIRIAAEELYALIAEKASGNSSVGIEIAQDEAPKTAVKLDAKTKKIIISVVAVVLVAAIVIGTLFFVNSKKNNTEPETSAPETTTPIETTTEAPVKVETMLLSQLMRYEAMNGITDKEVTTTPETTTVGAIAPQEPQTQQEPTDPNAAPSIIVVNGQELDAKEAIARIVESEMDNTFNVEALKAQAVVVYTYLKYRDTNWKISNLTIPETYSQEVYDAVNEVFGRYLTYNNELAFTPYCRMSAGKTASAGIIFGEDIGYLKSVVSTSDKQRDGYKQETLLTAEDIKSAVAASEKGITLGEDVSTWLSVTAHDASVSTGTGYVEKMTVGDKEVTGVEFIYDIMKEKQLASPCFSLSFDAENGTYTITTFGSGYGVGMSQLGADKLAISGTKFDKILDKYYPGTFLN